MKAADREAIANAIAEVAFRAGVGQFYIESIIQTMLERLEEADRG